MREKQVWSQAQIVTHKQSTPFSGLHVTYVKSYCVVTMPQELMPYYSVIVYYMLNV